MTIHEHTILRALVKQTDDLLFQMECAATMGIGFAGDHPMLVDVRKAVIAAKALVSRSETGRPKVDQ